MKIRYALGGLALIILGAVIPAHAVPSLINYQGRLTDAAGQAQAGPVTLTFRVYAAATGGSPLWGPQVFANTPLVDGYFNVILGNDSNSQAVGTAFGQAPTAYLEIQVGANPPISPRQQILSAPYAVTAQNADRLAFTTVTKTGNYTMLGTEDIVYVDGSSGSFTLTLPPAQVTTPAPFYGEKVITIKRTDNNLQFPISIAGTIDGASDWKLHTQNETYRIVRNGTQWQLLEHFARTPESPREALVITGSSGNPTKGGITAPAELNDRITWSRDGAYALVRFEYRQVTAGTLGGGTYLIQLPAGLSIDPLRAPFTPSLTDVTTASTYPLQSSVSILGTEYSIGGVAIPGDATHLIIYTWFRDANGSPYGRMWGDSTRPSGGRFAALSNNVVTVVGTALVPIAGWKP